ncbi:response regulator [Denitrobaculum tricleocarpae]|uniref:Response regulator n=1 Tax=Denitrobaculum tricleocarpae TaxID=2591009 RepID=A0A545TMQ6_9PROT|nr:response regulator [Denitrobaculum tricleocarpae]TQV78512.1 response regulator [Denitrobaculum tricleocarpae]
MAKILVVDDEPLICEMLEVFLSRAGHDVTAVTDGKQAVKAVESTPVDLVVADIVMPEKDGLETIMELQKKRPELKIIAISGGSRIGNFDFLAMAKKLGACKTFYKPLDNSALLVAINECLEDKLPT